MALDTPTSGNPTPPGGEPPRIHIDSDWKREAQAEKERLSREVEEKARAAAAPRPATIPMPGAAGPMPGAAGGHAAAEQQGGRIPPATFAMLLQTLATQAAMFLSDEIDPETGQPMRQLDIAKHNIDMLAVLEEKTKGNLTPDEARLLDSLLYELRMAYIQAAS